MQTKPIGQIHVYTGNGKGKTTAGLGLAIRALGNGKKVGLIYFDKGGSFYNERNVLTELKKIYPTQLDFQAFGTQRMVTGQGFRFENLPEDFAETKKALAQAGIWLRNDFDVLILDEFNTLVKTGLAKTKELTDAIKNKAPKMELILTGRYCPQEILELADLITEMTEVKHYVYQGIAARPGIDY